ncbi:hypothetical protein QF035_009473 [Streptomyces umbrinus]|uniref:Secreted protein n=1 Tax=Streptomyces umbrinus TaxID=67370 RepID=A0ABU0T7U9_9ACTN|nr:hypothetical protein [Streptomyces umbrinus]MDQ1031891.1 hypothetical protein [Streptomyces umbrinus]
MAAHTAADRIFGPLGLAVLLTAAVSFFGLRAVAEGMAEPSGESGHSHGGGTEEETTEHDTKEDPPASASESPAPESSVTSAESRHEEDGHGH